MHPFEEAVKKASKKKNNYNEDGKDGFTRKTALLHFRINFTDGSLPA